MTNKEAINRIKEILEEVKLCGVEQGNKDIEALDLAIKALERDNFDIGYAQGYKDGKEERPQGEWIKQEWGYSCSVCNETNDYAYDNNIHKFTDNFCPNCGADMRGKEE